LKVEKKEKAINCDYGWGPTFGNDPDLNVPHNCNTNADSYTFLDFGYTNDTRYTGGTIFTGRKYFQVKEVEVFEIRDQTALPPNPVS
jgi:hypothetical protein